MPKKTEEKTCFNCGHLYGLLNPNPECEMLNDMDCICNGRPNWIPMSDSQKNLLKLRGKNVKKSCETCDIQRSILSIRKANFGETSNEEDCLTLLFCAYCKDSTKRNQENWREVKK